MDTNTSPRLKKLSDTTNEISMITSSVRSDRNLRQSSSPATNTRHIGISTHALATLRP